MKSSRYSGETLKPLVALAVAQAYCVRIPVTLAPEATMQNNIGEWLEKHGLGAYSALFEAMHIGPDVLHSLTESDLRELDIPLGDRKRFLRAIQELPANSVERRQLTVLICDLVGSTELSERLDLESYRQCLATFRHICQEHIEFYDGYIYQYRGDAAIAYFSYPKGQEQSAARAAHAALGIVNALNLHNRHHKELPRLDARIGIATGLVVVGAELEHGTMHENAVGVAPNLAARLQGLAAPGEVIICELTKQLLDRHFTTRALDKQHVKGLDHDVLPYQLLDALENPLAELSSRQRSPLPFFGRQVEQEQLLTYWENAEKIRGFVQIIGEAGIGKSRFVREFRLRIASSNSPSFAYYCSPFHRSSALYPVLQNLRRSLQLQTQTTGELSLTQLRDGLLALGVQRDDHMRALATLLDVEMSQADKQGMNPHLKVDLFDAIITMLKHACRAQKALLIIEDAHWLDPSTEELLRKVIERQDELNCMILVTARPEFVWSEADSSTTHTLTLKALPLETSVEFVTQILGAQYVEEELIAEIVRKTAGIPLFIEETARAVLEEIRTDAPHALHGTPRMIGVPPTLNDSLMAKLDRLGDYKFTALVAAVVGQEFSAETLATLLSDTRTNIQDDLQYLVVSGVLKLRTTSYGTRYGFIHGLLQDVAYATLLNNTRTKIHSDVADTLIQQARESSESGPEIIAHHLSECLRIEEAVSYWIKAGRLASERSALQEAVVHFRSALRLMETLPDTADNIKIKLLILQGLAAPLLGTTSYRSQEVKEVANLAVTLCKQAKFENEIPVFLYTIWIGEQADGNHQYALSLARNFLDMARQHQDKTAQMVAHRALAWSELNLGNPTLAQKHLSTSRALYDATQHDALVYIYGTDHRIGIGCGEVQSLWALGYPDSALGVAAHTIQSAEESQLAVSRFLAYQYSGCLLNTLCKRWEQVAHFSTLLIRLGKENKLQQALLVGAFYRDVVRVIEEHSSEAFDSAMSMIDSAKKLGYLYMMPLWYTLLAEACLLSGLRECAKISVQNAIDIVTHTQENWYLAEIFRIEAELEFLQSGEFNKECEDKILKAIEIAGEQDAKSWELRARTSQRKLALNFSKQDQHAFQQCYVWFSEGQQLADWQQAGAYLASPS